MSNSRFGQRDRPSRDTPSLPRKGSDVRHAVEGTDGTPGATRPQTAGLAGHSPEERAHRGCRREASRQPGGRRRRTPDRRRRGTCASSRRRGIAAPAISWSAAARCAGPAERGSTLFVEGSAIYFTMSSRSIGKTMYGYSGVDSGDHDLPATTNRVTP